MDELWLLKISFKGHFAIIYPNLPTLREMCSQYIKIVLSNGNEIVMLLPFLETIYNVRRILTENSTNKNVRKYEKEQLLLILDSLKGYFGSPVGLMPFLSKYAKPYRAQLQLQCRLDLPLNDRTIKKFHRAIGNLN
ncbi:MAG: hypothetical protein WAM22_09755 [Nitrososphaeraceae archaeon]